MDRMLDIKAVCHKIGGSRPVNPATVYRAVQDGTLPKPLKFGRVARWRESEVDAVLERLAEARSERILPGGKRTALLHKA